MRHWSDEGGQVEPLAAVVAVVAVCVGFTLYAGVLAGEYEEPERATSDVVADRTVGAVTTVGVVEPANLDRAGPSTPAGWQVHVRLASSGTVWTHGPEPPPEANSQTRRVSVRHGPGRIQPGGLTVTVWR